MKKKQTERTVKISKEAYAVISEEKKKTKVPLIYILDKKILG